MAGGGIGLCDPPALADTGWRCTAPVPAFLAVAVASQKIDSVEAKD